jgi:hypothetical protein
MPEMDEFFKYVDVQHGLLVYFISSLFTLANLIWPLRKFDKEHRKSRTRARPDQLRELRLKGWKNSRGQHGPNFFDWFKEEVMLLNAPNSHYLSVPFFTLLKLTHHYYCGHAVLEESYY